MAAGVFLFSGNGLAQEMLAWNVQHSRWLAGDVSPVPRPGAGEDQVEQVLHFLFDNEKERRGALLVIAWRWAV
jgi:hypothetical protein